MFRIVRSSKMIYLLLEDSNTITAGTAETITFGYDGFNYQSIRVDEKENSVGSYELVLVADGNERKYDLHPYLYADGVYTKTEYIVENLSVELTFENSDAKYAGLYSYVSGEATATNYGVSLMKVGVLKNYVEIEARNVYFKEDVVSKIFDNNEAIIDFEDAHEILEGIGDDDLSLRICLKDSGSLAKFVGTGYVVEAELRGDDYNAIINYSICYETEDGDPVTGAIEKAPMRIYINGKTVKYGNDWMVEPTYSTDVEIYDYDKAGRISIMLSIEDEALNLSTSGKLNVGSYAILCDYTLADFYPVFVVDGNELLGDYENTASVEVFARELSLTSAFDMTEIFTKVYDGEKTCDISQLDLVGTMTGDDVVIVKGEYQNFYISDAVTVELTLGGDDAANYTLDNWPYGKIIPIVVGITFDYNAGGNPNVKSNVEINGFEKIAELAFPYSSMAYITANSYTEETSTMNNFPVSLTGRTGFAFGGWLLKFENVVEDSEAYNMFVELAEVNSLRYEYENEVFAFRVGNNPNTVSLLSALINDDTENYSGLYFKENDDINIKFIADWEAINYTVTLVIADETGRTAELGKAIVDNVSEVTRTDSFGYDYGDTVKIEAVPNSHCTYFGFYDAYSGVNYETSTADPHVSVVASGNGAIMNIDQITTNYTIVVRFKAQSVTVDVDVNAAPDSVVGMEGFEKISNTYSATKPYFDWTEITLADLQISRLGYALVSITNGVQTILATDFATTLLSSFVTTEDDNLIIVFTPNFEAVGVAVHLDYGYDDIVGGITVDFDSTYGEADGWEEEPEREGYEFLGWFNSENERVYGDTALTTTTEHTLTAHWQILDFRLTITVENATLVVDGEPAAYFNELVTYGEEVEIVVTPYRGYALPDDLGENVEITLNDDGSADIVITMPGSILNLDIAAEAKSNLVLIYGDRVANVTAFEIDDEENETEIEVENGVFGIETDKRVKIVVEAEEGYELIDEIIANLQGLNYETSVENGVLTILINNVFDDVEVEVQTQVSLFDVAVSFDDASLISAIIVGGRKYLDMTNLEFSVQRGTNLEIAVKYEHGYRFDYAETEGEYIVDADQIEIVGDSYTRLTISNVLEAGSIEFLTSLEEYTVRLSIISINENKEIVTERDNVALINRRTAEVTEEFGSSINLVYISTAQNYNFAGWSKDGLNVFDSTRNLAYVVEDNETIYAIFSAIRFSVSFATLENYTLYSEYRDRTKTETHYDELTSVGEAYFEDAALERMIDTASIYYGASKTIYYCVPEGYKYVGFGTKDGDNFVYLGGEESNENIVSFEISTLDFDESAGEIKIYVVVRALSSRANIETMIDFNGDIEENENIGTIELVDEEGNEVNPYGYVEGTRVHYTNDSFANGEVLSDKHFGVIAYTGEEIFIKISVERAGYRLYDVSATNDVRVEKIAEEDNVYIYKFSNFIGGTGFDVNVVFRPNLNKIDVNFTNGDNYVNGGAFNLYTTYTNKVFTSGTGNSNIQVSAYTDTSFRIDAYVKIGYSIDRYNINIIDENGVINRQSITYSSMQKLTTGYVCKVSFEVENYVGENEIDIVLMPNTYTVHFMEENTKLATIKNVEFDKIIDIFQTNSENITIFDERLNYTSGKLNLKLKQQNYNFEGFFSYENGAGIRYINSDGLACYEWEETGYIYDLATSTYKEANNAVFNEETGEIEISLYLYWSYLKTRITFDIVPAHMVELSAQDLISGVDYTNSWFYDTAPYYIEVAYNTNIKIVAPDISGYKFYKFVISQKDINGNWLTDVVAYVNAIPWSTNELDSIVECRIKVIYYAQIDVVVYGGEGTFEIEQEGETPQAQALINQNYIDTTNPFTLRALPAAGYEFVRWNNVTNLKSYWDEEITDLVVSGKATFVLNLQGSMVRLKFTHMDDHAQEVLYDTTFGQILSATVVTGTSSVTHRIGAYRGNAFENLLNWIDVKVGDKVTFAVAIDRGYGVEWNNLDSMQFVEYKGDRYYFLLEITADMAAQDFVRVWPHFKNEILSIYVTRAFAVGQEGKNAVDLDNVNAAGLVYYNGKKTDLINAPREADVIIDIKISERYSISSLTLSVKDTNYDILDFVVSGKLTISYDYILDHDITGVVGIKIEFERKLWEDVVVPDIFDGEGTDDDPYILRTIDDLILMMQYVNDGVVARNGVMYANASYKLAADLALGDKFWTPIGTWQNPFNGTFNFGGHSVNAIYNPYIVDTINYKGLFGVLGDDAVIIENSVATWYWYLAGGLGVVLAGSAGLIIWTARKRKLRRTKMSVK